jgi:hypothetical protein
MLCKGICKKFRAKKNGTASRYGNGQKRCQICDIFIKWDDSFCPCCKYRLRTKPRKQKYKIKLRDILYSNMLE